MSWTRYSDIPVYPTYYHVTNLFGLTYYDCINIFKSELMYPVQTLIILLDFINDKKTFVFVSWCMCVCVCVCARVPVRVSTI